MNTANVREWDHTSVTVADLDTATAFVRDAFGYVATLENYGLGDLIARLIGVQGADADLVQLQAPASAHTLELIQIRNVDIGGCQPPSSVGSGHLAFRVDDFDAAVGAVEALGARRIGEVVLFPGNRPAAYFHAPGGYAFELSLFRGAATRMAT